MTGAQRIREAIGERAVLMPGVYDALTARIAARVGFDVVFVSGYSVSAARLGEPDFGFLTQTEMADAARSVCNVSEAPVIVDADTGYGNPLNVIRTVGDLQDAGASGVFLEDQVWPKKCGHMEGKQVVETQDHAAKIRAAADARGERDLFIVARTDARQPLGLEAAIERCLAYKEAGADALFVEAPQSVEELEQIAAALPKPLVANMIERGATPHLSRSELEQLGFSLIVCPLSALFAAAKAASEVLTELKERETTAGALDSMLAFDELNELVGLEARYADETRYAQSREAALAAHPLGGGFGELLSG
ncbi:MAG: oxaloacetate decarboxylase, partial [Actinomycetota bacterium]|nr:oxaloacetate decarboxylase [Actinomycetota bacterium]